MGLEGETCRLAYVGGVAGGCGGLRQMAWLWRDAMGSSGDLRLCSLEGRERGSVAASC